VALVRRLALTLGTLHVTANLAAEVRTALDQLIAEVSLRQAIVGLIGFEKNARVLTLVDPARTAADV